MAASIFSSIQQLYGTLSFADKPTTLWLGTAPLKNADGTAVTLPVVEAYHERTDGHVTLEYQPILDWYYRFEVTTETEQQCEAIVYGMLYNGAAPSTASGFAYGTVTISSPWIFESLEMVDWPVFDKNVIMRSDTAIPTYKGSFRMLLKVFRSS